MSDKFSRRKKKFVLPMLAWETCEEAMEAAYGFDEARKCVLRNMTLARTKTLQIKRFSICISSERTHTLLCGIQHQSQSKNRNRD